VTKNTTFVYNNIRIVIDYQLTDRVAGWRA